MHYQGMVFRKEFPKGRKSGFLTVESDRIVFSSDDFKTCLSLRNIDIKLGGAANRLLYFTNPSDPETSFCTTEQQILKEHSLNIDPDCNEAIKCLKQGKRKSHAIIYGTLLLLAVLISLPFIFSDSIVSLAVNRIPFQWEQQFGEMTFKAVTTGKTVINDELLKAQLAKIYNPLLDVVKQSYPDVNFDFYIIEDPTLNAFAMPGGKVAIHSGLLLKSDKPEEIAALLAHEISHVTCRHHIREALKKLGMFATICVITGDTSKLGKLTTYAGSLVALKHSRKAEFEADAKGLAYLRQANIDPSGFIDLFRQLQSQNKVLNGMENALDILSTHPATEQRIEKLRIKNEQLSDDSEYYHFDLNFAEFQDNLAKALK